MADVDVSGRGWNVIDFPDEPHVLLLGGPHHGCWQTFDVQPEDITSVPLTITLYIYDEDEEELKEMKLAQNLMKVGIRPKEGTKELKYRLGHISEHTCVYIFSDWAGEW